MSPSIRTHKKVTIWLPRIWGFVVGGGGLVVGSLLVSLAFTDAAKRDPGVAQDFVYPYDL